MSRAYSLRPLQKDSSRKIPGYGVCDIESFAGWINFAVIGMAWRVYDEENELQKEQYEYFLNLHEFCDFIFSEDFEHNLLFAHFGGKYDFNFILKEFFFQPDVYFIHKMIPRGSGLLCFSVSKIERSEERPAHEDDLIGKTDDGFYLVKGRTIEFRDSSAMLPFGLASLTENFGVEHKKQEIDYDKIVSITPELLEYLRFDNWGLYECLWRYFNWPIIREAGSATTMASQALRVFRTFLNREISALRPSVDSFVRSSYFGGRTEIFKPFYQQHTDESMLRCYDVNSLYPFVMKEHDYPGRFKYETQFYMEDEIGFYDVEVEVPEMYVPPLGVRFEGMEDRLIFPTGEFRGVWSTMELNYAMTLGVKIRKVYRGMVFENIGRIFTSYIDHLYEIRKNSPKESVDNVICKLLMNSLYGRFGLNLLREMLVFDRGQLGVTPHMEIPLDSTGREIIRLAKQEVHLETSFTNVAIAAWVTSAARTHMHKLYMRAPEDLYYTDTDSLFSTFKYPRNDNDLGELKQEYKSKLAAFILPKTYMVDTDNPIFKAFLDNGKESELKTSKKLVMKGFDKKKISRFTKDDFLSALEGDMRRLRATNPKKFATLRTAVKKNEFLALLDESPRQIRTRYNKRRVFKRAWNQVYDTEPLHLKNGDITNLDKDILKKWKAPSEKTLKKIEQEAFKKMGALTLIQGGVL